MKAVFPVQLLCNYVRLNPPPLPARKRLFIRILMYTLARAEDGAIIIGGFTRSSGKGKRQLLQQLRRIT